ncbi:hypothetical protein [Peribacillus simplex]|uniref:hypothetical protein n=1 Tax=Peribacillus simplex TaxID=1478 RepID=UPI003D2992AC
MNRIEWISNTIVMNSAAGYYVGKDVTDEKGMGPYDRFSGYYPGGCRAVAEGL